MRKMKNGIVAKNLYLNEGLKIKFDHLEYRHGQFFFYHSGSVIAVLNENKLSNEDKKELKEAKNENTF